MGDEKAGIDIVREFFTNVRGLMSQTGLIILPYCSLSGDHNPYHIAPEFDLLTKEIVSEQIGQDVMKVFVFIHKKWCDILSTL